MLKSTSIRQPKRNGNKISAKICKDFSVQIKLSVDVVNDRMLNIEKYTHQIKDLKNLKQRLAHKQLTMLSISESRFKELVQLKEKTFLNTRSIVINTIKDDAKLVECANAIVESDYDFKTFTDF